MSAIGEQPPQIGDRQQQHAKHPVGAVDQGQAFFLGERDGRDAGYGERVGSRHNNAGCVSDDPLPHQRKGAVSKRGQVAGAAEAAVLVVRRASVRR